MAQIKAHVPDEVKNQFKKAAKEDKKPEAQLLRAAIQNYLTARKVR